MKHDNGCQSCSQRHNCGDVYRKMGQYKGPSLLPQVITAFVVPVVVLILAMAAANALLENTIRSQHLRSLISLLIALLIAFASVLIIRAVAKMFKGKTQTRE